MTTCREEILAALDRFEHRHGRAEFDLAEIVRKVLAKASTHRESIIRTHVPSRMCGDAPDHHGTTYDDLERVGRGRYRRRRGR